MSSIKGFSVLKRALRNIRKEGLMFWLLKVTRINLLYDQLKPFPSIIDSSNIKQNSLVHISAFSYRNAGDTVLPIVLRDLFDAYLGASHWKGIRVHKTVNEKILSVINSNQATIIGGGGLFLKDTNPNEISGWQWPCSLNNLRKIQKPIIMFAVGYNRFRGQEEFDPIFTRHLNVFVEKAAFIGIRNTGSIEKLKTYLTSDKLKDKLVFQPCMTTLIAKIYPSFCSYDKKEDFIAINCAFDRKNLRIDSDNVWKSLARVVSELSKNTRIKYYSHMKSDLKILPYFDELNISYELIEFKSPKQVVMEYSKPRLVIGMRGHAQMIPFGCQTPILSIISHDKMQWFLDDIYHPEWGVDVLDKDFETKVLTKANELYKNYNSIMADVILQQNRLWDLTNANLKQISNLIRVSGK